MSKLKLSIVLTAKPAAASLFALALLGNIFILSSAVAIAESEQKLPAPTKGVEFTKLQDLNPNSKPLNRPVRQKWAVVVGISKFQDKRLNTEQAYDKTARKFVDYLVSPEGGRFRSDHVRVLTDDQASLQSINNSFADRWLGKLVGPDDLVVVYVATRSFPTTDGNSYLCAYNCAMDNIYGSCLSIQSLMETLRKNINCDRIVLILESAYSGAVELNTGTKTPAATFNVDLEKVSLGKGFIVLSSSRPEQLSWQDLFTLNLIAALKEKDGLVPLQDAFAKARQETEFESVNSIHLGRKQTPVLKSDWQGNDLVLGCVPLDQTTGIPDSVQTFVGAEAHYLNANRAVMANDLEKAMAEYQAAILADPGLTDARADYAVALGMQGKWQEAEVELRKALVIKPDDALYLTNYARILDKLGLKEECKKALEKAYLVNPKDRVVLVALADKFLASGDRPAAMRLIDQALVLYPKNAIVQDRMCFLLSLDGRLDEAFQHAQEAVKLNPDLLSARLKLAALEVMKGNLQAAVKEYQTVLAKDANNADAHYLLAQAWEKLNESQNAGNEYKKFLELAAPTDPRRAAVEAQLKSAGSS